MVDLMLLEIRQVYPAPAKFSWWNKKALNCKKSHVHELLKYTAILLSNLASVIKAKFSKLLIIRL